MKTRTYSLTFLLVILMLIASTRCSFFFQKNEIYSKEQINYENNKTIKTSISHNQIYIYKNNFSDLPSCTGTGIYLDPYVIKNLEIDGEDNHSSIVIEDSDAFFRIENCTLYNIGSLSSESAGIKLINTSNGMLVNNSFSSNWDGNYGIYLHDICKNNTITNNTIISTQNGIYLNDNCHNNTITGNTITDAQNGIYLYKGCHNNSITDNIASDSTFSGIHLNDACNDNIFSGNILNNNDLMGMTISGSKGNNITKQNEFNSNQIGLYLLTSTNNIFSEDNDFSSNSMYGIYLSASSMNAFKGNTISNNNDIGLYVYQAAGGSNNNYFYENFFRSNGKHAVDEGLGNKWNSSNIGNYWDNYTEMGAGALDADDDGIGDIPYNFTGGIDYFPIWSDGIEGDFIEIDELASGYNAHNWTWASGRFWCSGSGTASDPYVIKPNLLWNGFINGAGTYTCISISNSTKYFRIEGCTFYNSNQSGAGIKLYNTTNGEITNNDFSSNQGHGIFLFNSSQNRFIGNTINNNMNAGIFLGTNSSKNEISGGNTLNGNKIGLVLKYNCDFNNISSNNLAGNSEYGVHIANISCNTNILNNNTFQANTLFNSLDNGTNTKWYYGELGNEWDDYPGIDLDDDGIGDTPYTNGGVYDKFPIFEDGLDGKPLNIDALATGVGAQNWTWASKRLYISGSGTFENPYVIKDIIIYGQNSESCIVINNSEVYFKIENCILYNSSFGVLPNFEAGIKLVNTTNGFIINNNVSLNNQHGIYLYLNCENNTISGNIINNNTYGIYLNNSNNNAITGNILVNNSNAGIYLYISDKNNFTGNILRDNVNNGVFLDDGGIGSNNNLFYNNNFTGNGIHAIDKPSNNYWNNTDIGNFWSNYTDVDANDNGIGDSPHSFNGGIDWLPIWDDGNNGSKIHIDGTGNNAPNWEWIVTRSWCSGSGTYSNPYIIRNVEINGENDGSGILIENSTVYFRIENSKVFNSGSDTHDAGIKLNNVSNGIIINNNSSDNNQNGIILYNKSSNNTISENSFSDNGFYGIKLEFQCENNTIYKNSISRNNIGVYLNQSYYSEISLNTIENNEIGIGVDFNSDFNNITHNIIKDNTDYGIVILQYLCEYNLLYNNSFVGNKIQAKNDGYNTEWDNGYIGNYWDDYLGKDPDDNGIGDTPYSGITGIIGSQDNYPILWDRPVPYIIDPVGAQKFGNIPPNYHIRIQEGKGYYFWYEILDIGINSSVTQLSGELSLNIYGTIDQNIWDSISNGLLNIRFYINDSRGYIGYKDVEIIKNLIEDIDNVEDDEKKIKEEQIEWAQAVYTVIFSTFAGFLLMLISREYKKRKEFSKNLLNNFEKVENIIAFLKKKLDNKDWIELQKPLEKYQKRHITSKNLIKEARKTIGEKFTNLFIIEPKEDE